MKVIVDTNMVENSFGHTNLRGETAYNEFIIDTITTPQDTNSDSEVITGVTTGMNK